MPQFSYQTAIRTSVFINIFLIAFLITFLMAQAMQTNTLVRIPAGLTRIVIDVRSLQLIIYKNNLPQKTFSVAIGKPGTPTPIGNWEIVSKEKWGEGFGSHWLGLNVPFGIYGIHGTNNPGSIGNIISGGCIHKL
jgi:lipoprotein-anchoring transpeptidase ErfK/SrfK